MTVKEIGYPVGKYGENYFNTAFIFQYFYAPKQDDMFEDFLVPVDVKNVLGDQLIFDNHILNHIEINEGDIPDLEDVDLAIIGVKEDRKSVGNSGSAAAPDKIRRFLYSLDKSVYPLKLVDLGNLEAGATPNDTYAALAAIVSELLVKKIVPIILGGSHDLSYAQYLGYARNEQIINICVVDESIDIYKRQEDIDASSFLYKIFTDSPNYLFNFSQIGYQSYYATPDDIETLERLYFEFYRLGDIRENLEEVEPIVRDADMASFDISALRQSDAPAKRNATPHGFFGEEACRIARYAGITDKLTSVGFYELNPEFDNNNQSAQLVAHMIWYFLEGYYNRTNEYPIAEEKDFMKYIVNLENESYELVFYKSKKSGRWWMQVPLGDNKKFERHQLIPCSYGDYQAACREEIPDRWLRAFEKMA